MERDDFRKDSDRVSELRAVLANPVLQEALLVIHDSKTIKDAGDDAPEIASVRLLSRLAGRAEVIRELYELGTPLTEPAPLPEPTYGAGDPPAGWSPDKI